MIDSIEFRNFKALRNTTLPLGRFTLLVGPNGSGKSTALQAVDQMNFSIREARTDNLSRYVSAGHEVTKPNPVELAIRWKDSASDISVRACWYPNSANTVKHSGVGGNPESIRLLNDVLVKSRFYSLDPRRIASAVMLAPSAEFAPDGGHLAAVLDTLRDGSPERFEALNRELAAWLPEFDRILFSTPGPGVRGFLLRTREGQHAIPAEELSQGTLLAVTLLTLAYLPAPPPLIGLEEPDRGIHPRLLREVRDAIYRLTHPESHGETRPPVQVVATTHSPYFLDLFKDHPEEIVIAQKEGLTARFERLADRSDIDEILADAPLGEVWYSGVLGGVPSKP